MKKEFTCIQCPQGCQLKADIENGYMIKLSGNECPQGIDYAKQEIENPVRVLTSSVLTDGLSLKMVAVKTDKPIPKGKVMEGMTEIKKYRLTKPVKSGSIIIKKFLGLNVNLVATRSVKKK